MHMPYIHLHKEDACMRDSFKIHCWLNEKYVKASI